MLYPEKDFPATDFLLGCDINHKAVYISARTGVFLQSLSFVHHSTPVARAPWQDDVGQWHITRYEDAKQALSHPETHVAMAWPRMMERAQNIWPDKFIHWPIILEIMNLSNNPWHSTLRKATAGVIHRLGEALPEGQTAELALSVCSKAPQEPVDAVSKLLNPVINNWLGASMGFTAAQVLDLRISGRDLINALSTGLTQVTPTQLETLAADLDLRYSSAVGRDKPDWTLDDHARLFPTIVAPNAMDGLLTNIMEHLAHSPDLQDQLRHCPRARRAYMFEAERFLVSLRYLYRKTGPSGLTLPSGIIPPRSRSLSIWPPPIATRIGGANRTFSTQPAQNRPTWLLATGSIAALASACHAP